MKPPNARVPYIVDIQNQNIYLTRPQHVRWINYDFLMGWEKKLLIPKGRNRTPKCFFIQDTKERPIFGVLCLHFWASCDEGCKIFQLWPWGSAIFFFKKLSPMKTYIFFTRRTLVAGPINLLVLYIHNIWDAFVGLQVLQHRFYGCIAHF